MVFSLALLHVLAVGTQEPIDLSSRFMEIPRVLAQHLVPHRSETVDPPEGRPDRTAIRYLRNAGRVGIRGPLNGRFYE